MFADAPPPPPVSCSVTQQPPGSGSGGQVYVVESLSNVPGVSAPPDANAASARPCTAAAAPGSAAVYSPSDAACNKPHAATRGAAAHAANNIHTRPSLTPQTSIPMQSRPRAHSREVHSLSTHLAHICALADARQPPARNTCAPHALICVAWPRPLALCAAPQSRRRPRRPWPCLMQQGRWWLLRQRHRARGH